jgi:MFS family permease
MVLSYGIGGIFSGYLLDRMAPRRIITIGALIAATGLILTGFIQSPWQFYLTYGVLCGGGSSCFGVVVCNASVGKWFIKKRGIALGTATMGVGVGTLVLSPLLGYIVQISWRTGFIFLGMIILIGVTVLARVFMKKTRPEAYGLAPDGETLQTQDVFQNDRIAVHTAVADNPLQETAVPNYSLSEVFSDSRFWIIALSFSLVVVVEMSVFVHQVAYAIDKGVHRIAAASSLGILGVASIFGRFFFGWLSDRIRDAKYAASMGFFAMVLGMPILMIADSAALLAAYALVFGFGYGSVAPLVPVLLADRFGRDVLGATYGVMTFFVAGIGGSLGPLLCGYIYDQYGTYSYAWQIGMAILLFASLLILGLRRPSFLKES